MDMIKENLSLMMTDRQLSWPIAALIYTLLSIFIRGFFVRTLLGRVYELKRAYRKEIKHLYLRRAMWGWLAFVVSIVLFIFNWVAPAPVEGHKKCFGLLVACAVFNVLFILIHVQSIGWASLTVFKQQSEKDLSL